MNALALLKNQIVGVLAEQGRVGLTCNQIESKLSVGVIRQYKDQLNGAITFDSEVLKMVLGEMVQEGTVNLQAPGGIYRYVLTTLTSDLVGEINSLKERVNRLELLLSQRLNS